MQTKKWGHKVGLGGKLYGSKYITIINPTYSSRELKVSIFLFTVSGKVQGDNNQMFQEDETIELHLSEPTCVPAGLCQTEANNIWLNTGITLHYIFFSHLV